MPDPPPPPPPPGTLFVVAAPSGAGKTSLVRALLEGVDDVVVSVSHTTRPPRPGERTGVDYHFTDPETFQALVARGAFLEHALVFGHHYGTGRDQVQARLAEGVDVILEIDWQGARQVRDTWPDCIGIFILPPSLAVLRDRLQARGQDQPEVIERRMRAAAAEISHWEEFDYAIVNDHFGESLKTLQAIVRARRARRAAVGVRHSALIDALKPHPV